MIKIPKSFKLFASKIKVVVDDKRMNDKHRYGECDYSTSQITLSTVNGVEELSDDKRMDTFYHERVHMILDHMHEYDLSQNEKFVDLFAKLQRQADETSEY